MGIEIQRAKIMHQFRSWAYLFMAVGYLIVSIPLVRRFGGFGAAIGTSLSYIIGNGLLMNLYNHSKIGLNMNYFWKEITSFITAFIIPTLYGVGINYFINLYSIGNLLIYGLRCIVSFNLPMWNYSINEYERALVRDTFKRNRRN